MSPIDYMCGVTGSNLGTAFTTRTGPNLFISSNGETSWKKTITIVPSWNTYPKYYLIGCTTDKCLVYHTLLAAQTACLQLTACGGVTGSNLGTFTTRTGLNLFISPTGETSWKKTVAPVTSPTPVPSTFIPLKKVNEVIARLK